MMDCLNHFSMFRFKGHNSHFPRKKQSLSKVARKFRELNGRKMRTEIILIRGASVFAINEFGDEYGLPTVGLTQILL